MHLLYRTFFALIVIPQAFFNHVSLHSASGTSSVGQSIREESSPTSYIPQSTSSLFGSNKGPGYFIDDDPSEEDDDGYDPTETNYQKPNIAGSPSQGSTQTPSNFMNGLQGFGFGSGSDATSPLKKTFGNPGNLDIPTTVTDYRERGLSSPNSAPGSNPAERNPGVAGQEEEQFYSAENSQEPDTDDETANPGTEDQQKKPGVLDKVKYHGSRFLNYIRPKKTEGDQQNGNLQNQQNDNQDETLESPDEQEYESSPASENNLDTDSKKGAPGINDNKGGSMADNINKMKAGASRWAGNTLNFVKGKMPKRGNAEEELQAGEKEIPPSDQYAGTDSSQSPDPDKVKSSTWGTLQDSLNKAGSRAKNLIGNPWGKGPKNQLPIAPEDQQEDEESHVKSSPWDTLQDSLNKAGSHAKNLIGNPWGKGPKNQLPIAPEDQQEDEESHVVGSPGSHSNKHGTDSDGEVPYSKLIKDNMNKAGSHGWNMLNNFLGRNKGQENLSQNPLGYQQEAQGVGTNEKSAPTQYDDEQSDMQDTGEPEHPNPWSRPKELGKTALDNIGKAGANVANRFKNFWSGPGGAKDAPIKGQPEESGRELENLTKGHDGKTADPNEWLNEWGEDLPSLYADEPKKKTSSPKNEGMMDKFKNYLPGMGGLLGSLSKPKTETPKEAVDPYQSFLQDHENNVDLFNSKSAEPGGMRAHQTSPSQPKAHTMVPPSSYTTKGRSGQSSPLEWNPEYDSQIANLRNMPNNPAPGDASRYPRLPLFNPQTEPRTNNAPERFVEPFAEPRQNPSAGPNRSPNPQGRSGPRQNPSAGPARDSEGISDESGIDPLMDPRSEADESGDERPHRSGDETDRSVDAGGEEEGDDTFPDIDEAPDDPDSDENGQKEDEDDSDVSDGKVDENKFKRPEKPGVRLFGFNLSNLFSRLKILWMKPIKKFGDWIGLTRAFKIKHPDKTPKYRLTVMPVIPAIKHYASQIGSIIKARFYYDPELDKKMAKEAAGEDDDDDDDDDNESVEGEQDE